MLEDAELLRDYAQNHSNDAFTELVRRRLDLVYSVALRQVNGDSHLAQDVTQIVFTDLARKAATLADHRVLAGWLFTSTRFAAAKLVRGERRRQMREQEAQLMHQLSSNPTASLDWDRVRPVLDDVVGKLGNSDREAILLRFFEARNFSDIGSVLNVSDNTARMRVERALDKLRGLLEQRGVKSTSAALAAVLANQAVVAAPTGLVAAVVGAAVSGAGTAAGAMAGGRWDMALSSLSQPSVWLAGVLALTIATGLFLRSSTNAALPGKAADLSRKEAAVVISRAENLALTRSAAEAAKPQGDEAEFKRLNVEVASSSARPPEVTRPGIAKDAIDEVLDHRDELARFGPIVTPIEALSGVVPRAILQAHATYPPEMKNAGIAGEVTVEFVVDHTGRVQNTGAAKSSRREFEAAAVEAVSGWKFLPRVQNGRAVDSRMTVPIVFAATSRFGLPGTMMLKPDSKN